MEKQTNRTLAYLLAQPIQDHELDAISGGTMGATSHQTVTMTGNSAQGPVVHYDVTVDL